MITRNVQVIYQKTLFYFILKGIKGEKKTNKKIERRKNEGLYWILNRKSNRTITLKYGHSDRQKDKITGQLNLNIDRGQKDVVL